MLRCARWLLALAALVVGLFVPAGAAATALPETITEDTTLTPAGNPYTGSPTIESGVTVTAEPGTEFKVNIIIVKGTLNAEGTAEEPILFTGSKEEKAGEWNNVKLEPGSGESVLDHVEVAFGGAGGVGAIETSSSSPTIENSTVYKAKEEGILVRHGGSPEIANNLLVENGILYGRAAIAYWGTPEEPGEVNIHDNLVEGGGSGIYVSNTSTEGAGGTLGGNVVIGTAGVGLSYTGADIPGNITENTLSGNKNDELEIGGTVAHSSTWGNGGSIVNASSDITIASGVTLTIEAGVMLRPKSLIVKGTLKAEGTAEEPILFTGSKEEKAGEWNNVKLEPGSGESVLDHVEVAFGGAGGVGAIETNSSSPTIENSTVYKAKEEGILVRHGGSPEIANNLLVENGILYGRAAIAYWGTPEEPGEVNIHDNLVEGGGSGIYVSNTSTEGAGGTLGGNVVIGTEGVGLSYTGADIPGNITENTLSGNSDNRITVSGTVAHSSTWKKGGTIVKGSGEVTVAAGVTLTVDAGVVFLPPTFIVKGTLKAEGTAKEPVVFTGAKEEKSGSTDVSVGHVTVTRPGRGGHSPLNFSIAREISASAE